MEEPSIIKGICTPCSKELGVLEPSIDVEEIYNNLKARDIRRVQCQSCKLRAILHDPNYPGVPIGLFIGPKSETLKPIIL